MLFCFASIVVVAVVSTYCHLLYTFRYLHTCLFLSFAAFTYSISQCFYKMYSRLIYVDTAEVVITQLKEKSKAVSLTQLATFVETLPQIEKDLNRMKEITGGLRVNASQLSDGKRNDFHKLLTFTHIHTAFGFVCFSNSPFLYFLLLSRISFNSNNNEKPNAINFCLCA